MRAAISVTPRGVSSRKRKKFFFEKKNQKTFALRRYNLDGDWLARSLISAESKSFLVLFFKKELLPSCYPHSHIEKPANIALHEAAAGFYAAHGFVRLPESLRLVLPMRLARGRAE